MGNLMGNLKNLLGIKPKSFGDALKAVKKHFNAIGDDLAHIPGQRIYKTPSDNRVVIDGDSSRFSIRKVLNPFIDKQEYNSYVGKPAEITVSRGAYVKPGDTTVHRYSHKNKGTFAPLNSNKRIVRELSSYESKKLFNVDNTLAINDDYYAKPKVTTKTSYRHENIPYQKAVSMGLKI